MDIKVEKHKDGVVTIEGQESAQDYVRFSVLPAYILASKELSANEKLVYCVIYTFNTNEKDFFGSNQFIAQSTGLTAGAVQNILTKLESKKLITRIYVDNNPIKGRAIIRLGQGYHQGMIGLSSDNDTPYHRRVIPLSSESDHTNKDTNKDTNKVKEKKGSANFTRSQFLKEKEQILEEAKKKYPHRDCDKAVSDFIDKTAIKDYNYKNYKLAFYRWVREDTFKQYKKTSPEPSLKDSMYPDDPKYYTEGNKRSGMTTVSNLLHTNYGR